MLEILPPINEEDKFIAALSYPFWFVVSWLILITDKKKEPFLFCHAYQSLFLGLFLTVATLLLFIIITLFFGLTSFMASMFTSFILLGTVLVLIVIVMAEFAILLYLAYMASMGKMIRVPYIYKYVEKLYFKAFPQK
ncbi:MAG: hypothetical protein ABIH00_04400 [Armatimonadota bacterium]